MLGVCKHKGLGGGGRLHSRRSVRAQAPVLDSELDRVNATLKAHRLNTVRESNNCQDTSSQAVTRKNLIVLARAKSLRSGEEAE